MNETKPLPGWRTLLLNRRGALAAVLVCIASALTVRAVRLARPAWQAQEAASVISGENAPTVVRNGWEWRYPTALVAGETQLMTVRLRFACLSQAAECLALLQSSATEADRTVVASSAGLSFSPPGAQVAKSTDGATASVAWTLTSTQLGRHQVLLDLTGSSPGDQQRYKQQGRMPLAAGDHTPVGMYLGVVEVKSADPWWARPSSAAVAAWVAAIAAVVALVLQWKRG